jgi:hypothetical protein
LKLIRIKIFVEIIYHESYDRRTIADIRKTWKAQNRERTRYLSPLLTDSNLHT